MRKKIYWSTDPRNKVTFARRILSYLSLMVREEQFKIFIESVKPRKGMKILDMGVTPVEDLIDSNFFEKRYPYKGDILAASVENCHKLKQTYPKVKFKKVEPYSRLPFRSQQFDIAVSWATLEHAGTRRTQSLFLKELMRVAKKIFITTPNKNLFYEPHSGLLFVHWLPNKYFRKICKLFGKDFWGNINNLNPLNSRDVQNILPIKKKFEIKSYKMFGIFSSHILIIKNDAK